MPTRKIPGTDLEYHLISFDADGIERREPDEKLLSNTLLARVANAAAPVTDVLFASHGWKGDIPAAVDQYDRWIGAMLALPSDREAVRRRRAGYNPLIIGLHWPSLPWGDETLPTDKAGVLSDDSSIEAQVDAYAARIANTPKARSALRSIFEEVAREHVDGATLSPGLLDAYASLFAESGLQTGDPSGRPGADQDGFDPAAIYAEARVSGLSTQRGPKAGLLSVADAARDALLMPLRQLSFWKMKDRARRLGETGGHDLLARLQVAAPKSKFHLMGHSFGCIVQSATVAGAPGSRPLPRPVDSLFLVQGALSLWSYARDIPYAPGTAGYFNRIVREGLVRGPIITTRSTHDTAIGRFYPLGARLKRQLVLGEEYPAYGGVGAFGIRGNQAVEDLVMQSPWYSYDFRGGHIYNLDASDVIRNGSGPSGAHSDIAHPEVAHAFWGAILGSQLEPATIALSAGSMRPADPSGVRSTLGASLPPSAPSPAALGLPTAARGGLLSAEPPRTPRAQPTTSTPSRETNRLRWINAELEDHAPQEPLQAGKWYTLAFDVDLVQRATAVATATLPDFQQLFPPGVDEVRLTIQVDSTDFEVSDHTRPLRLPRDGRSFTKARFEISPLHTGPSGMKVTVHKDGNFIQQMELLFDVGATSPTQVQTTARGRPVSASSVLLPRDISLTLSPITGGYECIVSGAVAARAMLPLLPGALENAVEVARRELLKVVMYTSASGDSVFQFGIDIAAEDQEFALKTMARAGALLFQKIFYGPAAREDSRKLGDFLKLVASDRSQRLKLQIVAESTPLPWGLLYIGDASTGAQLDWDNFLGMRHIIEQIPLQNTLTVSDCVMPSEPDLALSINLNSTIDAQMQADFVARQRSFWATTTTARRGVRMTGRESRNEVVRALADATTDDQIVYFYCHAASVGLSAGGPDASCLVLSDASITLGDLKLDAPPTTQLRGKPLVFINACESADLSPAFYDGFVPYFMDKGARGVVGTECKTPALFAMEWAQRFFMRFLDGESLGEVFLGLRREFLEKHGNPLGLLYAVYCNGDTVIKPALASSSAACGD
jgi:hypothetical protein